MSRYLRVLPVAVALVLAGLSLLAGLWVAADLARPAEGLQPTVPVRFSDSAPMWTEGITPVTESGPDPRLWPVDRQFPVERGGQLELPVPPDTTAGINVLAGTPWLAVCFGLAAALVTLGPALRQLSVGRSFTGGVSTRLAATAGVVTLSWFVAVGGPMVAGNRLLADGGVSGMPSDWVTPVPALVWWPGAMVALLLFLAAAVRRGERLMSDTEGLV